MRDTNSWLGDGGMPLLTELGAHFDRYGMTDGGLAYAELTWKPTQLGSNPGGIVQGGVHCVILDAAMGFALNTALDGRDRARASLEVKTETMRSARAGDALQVRGEVVRLARQVAYLEGRVSNAEDELVSRSTATFLLHREPVAAGTA